MAQNIWKGNDGTTPGDLSVAGNWSLGHVLTTGETAMFVPEFNNPVVAGFSSLAAVTPQSWRVLEGYTADLTDGTNAIQFNGTSAANYYAGGGRAFWNNVGAGIADWQIVGSKPESGAIRFFGKCSFYSGILGGQITIKTGAILAGMLGNSGAMTIESGVAWALGTLTLLRGIDLTTSTSVPSGTILESGRLTTLAAAALSGLTALGGRVSHQSTGNVTISLDGSAQFDGSDSAGYQITMMDFHSAAQAVTGPRATFASNCIRLFADVAGPILPSGSVYTPTPP